MQLLFMAGARQCDFKSYIDWVTMVLHRSCLPEEQEILQVYNRNWHCSHTKKSSASSIMTVSSFIQSFLFWYSVRSIASMTTFGQFHINAACCMTISPRLGLRSQIMFETRC